MTTPICVNLSVSLNGSTNQGAITPIDRTYALDTQDGHQQLSGDVTMGETKVVAIPTNLAGPNATLDPLTLLIITLDIADVEVVLNSGGTPVGPFQAGKVNGVLILPGQVGAAPGVPVADVSFENNGTSDAKWSITAVYGN